MSEFIRRYYDSPIRADRIQKNRRISVKSLWQSAFDVVVSDHFVGEGVNAKHRMSAKILTIALLLLFVPAAACVGTFVFKNQGLFSEAGALSKLFAGRIYYIVSLLTVLAFQLPFFLLHEKKRHNTFTAVRIAAMTALNVTGRAAFFMFSDFKPVYAITIISGISLGSLGGFMTGALTMLVSNFLFGQGPWTPWQMFALGLIGFISGALTEGGLIPRRRLTLAVFGFVMALVIYGGIMNPAAMFMSVGKPTWKLLLAYYVSGLPVDLVKGTATFLFLWIGAEPVLRKIERM